MLAAEIWTRAGVDDAKLDRSIAIRQNTSRNGIHRSITATRDNRFISFRLARKTRRILNVLQCNNIAFWQKRA